MGRWLGVPIRAHWSLLIAVVLFATLIATVELPASRPGLSTAAYWWTSAVTAPLFFLTLLAHELAHALTARHYGLGVRRITLWVLGGLTEMEGHSPTPRADGAIAAAGPLTSLLIGGVCAGAAWLTRGSGLVTAALTWLAGINVLLAVFNLLPGAPLDGGRLVRALLWWRSGDRLAAADRAVGAGRVLGQVMIGLGVLEALTGFYAGLWLAVVGWVIVNGAASERYSVVAEILAGLHVRDVMTATPRVAPDWWTVDQLVSSLDPAADHQDVIPLVDLDGHFSGAVTLAMLTDAAQAGPSVRLGDLTHGHLLLTAEPGGDLGALLLPMHLRGGIAVVLDAGHPVGVVTEADLARAARIVRAGGRRGRGD
jgi:Zn-dependent protease